MGLRLVNSPSTRRPDTRRPPDEPAENFNPTPGIPSSSPMLPGGGLSPADPSTPGTQAPGNQFQADGSTDPRSVPDPLGFQIQRQLDRVFARPPVTSSPRDSQLQGVQRDVERLEGLQAAYNSAETANNLGILEQKLREMGLWNGKHPGLSYEDSIKRSANEALAQLPVLNQRVSQIGTEILGDRAAGAEVRESELKQGLSTTGDLLSQLIDQKLREKIGDIGMQGQEVRSQLGASLAARGLNQSSFGAQRVAQSYLAEQQDVAQARTRSAKTVSSIGSAIDDVSRQIETRRREMANRKTLSQATTAEDVAFDIDSSALNNRFKEEVAQLELDARSSGFLGSFLGGIAGAIGGFFAAGPLGVGKGVAVGIGFGAGSKAGGALD